MKVKVPFVVATPDLKGYERKMLDVEVKIPESMEVHENIEYSVKIPDHMFVELADTEPRFKTSSDVYNTGISGCFSKRDLTRKFKKTQTSILLETLQEYISSLTQHINDRHSIETATMKKKIFISFNHSDNHTRNNLNGGYTGRLISQRFQFFTGYEVMTDKFSGIGREVTKKYITKIHYAPPSSSIRKLDTNFEERDNVFHPLPNLNESVASFESRYSIIDWTEERENFCKKIQDTFTKVNGELSEFLKDISEEKMDALMSGQDLKFLKE